MTQYDLYKNLQATLEAMKEFNRDSSINENRSLWNDEIRKIIPELIKESYILGSAGIPCPTCGGTGRQN